jgi:spermidine/putrescine transport system ATP-binding protein
VNAVDGTVLDASYIGVSTQYLVETRDGHKMTAYTQNLETAGLADLLARGAKVRLTWQPRHTFVLAGSAEHAAGDPHAPEEEGDLDV